MILKLNFPFNVFLAAAMVPSPRGDGNFSIYIIPFLTCFFFCGFLFFDLHGLYCWFTASHSNTNTYVHNKGDHFPLCSWLALSPFSPKSFNRFKLFAPLGRRYQVRKSYSILVLPVCKISEFTQIQPPIYF